MSRSEWSVRLNSANPRSAVMQQSGRFRLRIQPATRPMASLDKPLPPNRTFLKRSSSEVLLTRLTIAASLYQKITISLICRIEKHDWRYVTMTPVRVIIALTMFLYACDVTSGDEDERFVNRMCHQSMQSEETLPDTEIDKFCDCASDEVARNWSSRQQASIREARKLLANSEPPHWSFVKYGRQ